MITYFNIAIIITVCLTTTVYAKQSVELPETITLNNAVMKLIPAGEFIMGSNKKDEQQLQSEFGSINPWFMDEHPKHSENLAAYYINQYEITNSQFKQFVKNKSYMPPDSWISSGYIVSMKMDKLEVLPVETIRKLVIDKFRIDIDTRSLTKTELINVISKHFSAMDNLPVNDIDWFGAEAYCEWVGAKLPTELEWEKAARGKNGNEFPWGNGFESGLSNTGEEDWPMGLTPGGFYQRDKSDFGIFDLAGNVSEWVFDWYEAYPNSDYKSERYGKQFKVVRGAGWGGNGHYALELYQRGAYRYAQSPDAILDDLGFRCAANVDTALHSVTGH